MSTTRYWEYMPPASAATVLPFRALAVSESPQATTTPAPSLPYTLRLEVGASDGTSSDCTLFLDGIEVLTGVVDDTDVDPTNSYFGLSFFEAQSSEVDRWEVGLLEGNLYKTAPIVGTIDSTAGFSASAQMISDE